MSAPPVTKFAGNVKKHSSYFEEVVQACKSLLYNHPIADKALQYLNSRVSRYSQDQFGFGYFPPDKYIDTLIAQVDINKLLELKLIYKRKVADGIYTTTVDSGSLSRHNLIMPYRDAYGNIVALVGRSLLPEDERKDSRISKYKNTAFIKSVQLFGLDQAKRSIIRNNSVIIVEGQIDCITAHEFGYHNVVALGGVAFTAYHFWMLRRYTNNFYLLLDTDEEGQNSTNKIISKYGQLANIKTLSIPDIYKDVDEALRKSKMDPLIDQII